MAQDKEQEINQQGGQDTKSQYTPTQSQKNAVDVASINASAANDAGEFMREGKKGEQKKDIVTQEPHDKSTVSGQSPKKSKESKKEYAVPVLRTYQQDTRDIAQTKGGAELRTILAKEAEEKRVAQEEYRRKTKDIMKESVVLRDRYKNFVQGKQGQEGDTHTQETPAVSADAKSAEQGNITRVLSGATAYMQTPQESTAKQKKAPQDQPIPKATAPTEGQSKPTAPTETKNREASGGTEGSSEQAPQKQGIFARTRGRMLPKNVFTEKKRGEMRQQQQEVVEKKAIQDAWKDFKQKKKKLQEVGLQARDVRSYATSADESIPNKPLRRQNMLLLAIVFFLLAGMISSIIFLAVSPAEKPTVNNNTAADITRVSDVLNSEKQVFVDTSDAIVLSDMWQSITEKDGEQDTIIKYVPYRSDEEKESQISFRDFSDAFNIRFPAGLQNAFGDYYFVGKYLTQGEVNGIFIASVKKYGDAFVWTRSWEENIVNAFSAVFPNFFQQSKVNNVITESRIIDNQDVRVIRNPTSQREMFYYFFGRSILVFIAGEESAIPLINARIRATNTF